MSASPHKDEICISNGPVKGDVVIKKDRIYFIKSDGLYKMRTDGNETQLLHKGDIGDRMTVSGGRIYFSVRGDGLYRMPLNGGEAQLLQKCDVEGRIAVSGSWVYYAERSTGLCRMWEDGSYVRILVPDPSAELISVAEGHIYFTRSHTKELCRSWEDGDNQELFDIFGKDVIHVADGRIYSKDRDSVNFYTMRIDRTKLNRSQMDLSNESFYRIVYADTADGWIFYDVDGSLYKMRTDESDAEKLSDAMTEGIRKAVDDHIYYVKEGRLFRKPIA